MAKAIRFDHIGGPEVLRMEQVEVGDPGPGQARVRHSYVAVNFIDTYFRTGTYPLALPNGLGSDAVLRHIQTGRRKASAEMAVRIEKAAKKAGVDVPRESLCETCRKCDLAKAARKNGA